MTRAGKEWLMKTFMVAVVVAGVLGVSGLAHAAQIASPSIFGNQNQSVVECVVLNFGTRPVAVTLKIIDELAATKATSTCDGALAPGEFCSVSASLFVAGFGCTATAPSTATLRGTLIINQRVVDDFGVTQLQPIVSTPLR